MTALRNNLTLLILAACFVLAQLGCGSSEKQWSDPKKIGSESQEIIGGTPSTQAQVGLLRAHLPNTPANQYNYCSFTKISTNVLLTAAHCTANPPGTTYDASFNANGLQGPFLPIQRVAYSGAVDFQHLENGHDVGIAVLTTPETTIPPLRLNKTHRVLAGSMLRIIGYGLTNVNDPNSFGRRLETNITVAGENNQILVSTTNAAHMACNGDSGGPATFTANGQNRLVGLISFGNACTNVVLTRPETDDTFISSNYNTDLTEAWFADVLGRQADDSGLLSIHTRSP
jgi:V8-like Glu-specific endopeptidase